MDRLLATWPPPSLAAPVSGAHRSRWQTWTLADVRCVHSRRNILAGFLALYSLSGGSASQELASWCGIQPLWHSCSGSITPPTRTRGPHFLGHRSHCLYTSLTATPVRSQRGKVQREAQNKEVWRRKIITLTMATAKRRILGSSGKMGLQI